MFEISRKAVFMVRQRLQSLFLKKTMVLLYLGCFFCAAAQCQDRPRIALVLIGVGESSIAGIGVIKALDQLHVPIDIVTGSGMGALIGAAFASGLTAEELESIFTTNNLDDLTRDVPVSEYLLVSCVHNQGTDSQCPKDAGTGTLLSKPSLITGRNMDVLSQTLMTRSLTDGSTTDLNRLPISFLALTTDVLTLEPVFLASGSIVAAAKSALLPLDLANAIKGNEGLLIDIPGYTSTKGIRAARDSGADSVIVVSMQAPLLSLEQLISREMVLQQIVMGFGRISLKEAVNTLGNNDVFIQPDLGNYGSGHVDYPKVIESGRAKTLVFQEQLESLALPEEEYQELLRKRRAALH